MRVLRLCAVHKARLIERIDPERDTSGLYCLVPLPGESHGHDCLKWVVTVDGQMVAAGSQHPTQADEYVWMDDVFFWPARAHVERLAELMTGSEGRSPARSVSGSLAEDCW
jgi:hypothetical protein